MVSFEHKQYLGEDAYQIRFVSTINFNLGEHPAAKFLVAIFYKKIAA
jgi:hypothetical protein